MTTRRRPPGKTPSAAERDLFRRAMADATPLDGAPLDATPGAQPPPEPKKDPPAAAKKPPPPPVLTDTAAPGLDGRTMTRLKRGQIRPEARLDLHGMTLDEGHRAVVSFVGESAGRGRRCVIVITGKGKVGQTSGTLRAEFPRWLNQGETRGRVLAFTPAQPKDGGPGAWYVLLRRNR